MHIKGLNGLYLTAEQGGGLNGDPGRGASREDVLICNRTDDDLEKYGDSWQQFSQLRQPDGTVHLKIGEWYVTAEGAGGQSVSTDRTDQDLADFGDGWQRFTAVTTDGQTTFQCPDRTHFLRVRSDKAQPLVDCTGLPEHGAEIQFQVPETPKGTIKPLSASGVTLRNPDGERISLNGYDMFTALRLEIDDPSGGKVQPFIEEMLQRGFNLARVFMQASSTKNGYYTVDPKEPGYDAAVERLAQRLTSQGVYGLFECYADNSVFGSTLERWQRNADILRPFQEGIFFSGGNEWQQNNFDPNGLPDPGMKWWSRGSSVGDQPPPNPNGATFVLFHPRRDYPKSLDDTVASATYIQYTYRFVLPLIVDEPPRMGTDGSGDVYMDPQVVWQFARHYNSQCAGAVLHTRAGQKGFIIPEGSNWDVVTRAWCSAWDDGVPNS